MTNPVSGYGCSGMVSDLVIYKFKEYGWMNGVLGDFYAQSRLNWAGDNLD